MLAVAVILLAVGGVSIVFGLFWTSTETGADKMMGVDLGPTPIFLWGVIAAVCILLGLRLLAFGTRHKIKHHREQKRLRGMAEKLNALEAERTKEAHDGE